MAESFKNSEGKIIVENLIIVVKDNRQYLSDIDGAIGDGDHGINMAKGFSMAGERLTPDMDLSASLKCLGSVLMMEIGGSMGPLYGKFFRSMAKECKDIPDISLGDLARMLRAGYDSIVALGGAKPGDKTLIDTLDPAVTRLELSEAEGNGFAESLGEMRTAAEKGKDATKDMIAQLGRASRLGERSKGVLDAGATSCWLILDSIATTIGQLLT